MSLELTGTTEAGRRMVALAERLAEDLATRAGSHDRDASYPHASIDALKASGYFAAPIPQELGGLGATSVHDVIVASSRLARGDASVAIGVNMHFAALLNAIRRWQMARAAGDPRRAEAFGVRLRALADDGEVMAAAISEPRQDLTRPATTATRTASGWRIDGRKIFCTMSPAATTLYTAVTFVDRDGIERYGYAMVPAATPGVVIHDDWDALGMRASGSHSVSFDGVELPAEALRGGFPAGEPAPYMERNLTAGLFHASASLGIAEAAESAARRSAEKRLQAADEPRSLMLVAENAIDLSVSRAALSRAAAAIDDQYATHRCDDAPEDELTALFADAQATKTFVNEAAARIVDRALGLSGGAGYLNGNPLARAYRDVKAGAFMHPLGSNRAYDFVGRVALGLDPALH